MKPTTYLISASDGDDRNDGVRAPWKTLSRITGVALNAGDRILLKCGDIWNETLAPCGDGAPDDPIVISSYGSGARPYINKSIANARDRCILLDRVMGYRIAGLELGGAWHAVEIRMDHGIRTVWNHYEFEDCYFHDIINPDFPHDQSKGVDLSDWPWAIYRTLNEASDGCICSDLTVRHCFSTRCQGFHSVQYSEGGSGFGSIAEVNTLFEGNTFQYCHYNNIYMCNSTNGVMRDCVMVFGYPNRNIWPFGNAFVISGSHDPVKPTTGNTLTGNEFGWVGDIPGGVDGCVYDLEYSQTGTVFRDNFAHDAFGEGYLIMGYCKVADLAFEGNITCDVLLYCTNRDMAFDIHGKEGTGIFSGNKFFLRPGQRAFNKKPPEYEFIDNDENATGVFTEMPMVSNIKLGADTRSYTFQCASPGAEIRYTTDGSVPKPDSLFYSGPVKVSRSCVINAKAFKEGEFASNVNSILADFRDDEGRTSGMPSEEYDDFSIVFRHHPDSTFEFRADDYLPDLRREIPENAGSTSVAIVVHDRQPHLFINGIYRKAGFRRMKSASEVLDDFTGELEKLHVFDYAVSHARVQMLALERE